MIRRRNELSVEVSREDLRERKQQLDSKLQALSQERVSLMRELEKLSNSSLAGTAVHPPNPPPSKEGGSYHDRGSPLFPASFADPLSPHARENSAVPLRVSRQYRAGNTVIPVGERGIPLGCADRPQII